MATLKERLEDTEYKLWVKAGICLASTKDCLEKFAKHFSDKAHTIVMAAVHNITPCNSPNIKYDRARRNFQIKCCTNCDKFITELNSLCVPPFNFNTSNLKNSDAALWPTEAWEMMKVYMNPGQKSTQKSPADSDLSAILNFFDRCKIANVEIKDRDNIGKVRDARNDVMHSAHMKLKKDEFDYFTKRMIDLLEDKTYLKSMGESKKAVEIIKEANLISSARDMLYWYRKLRYPFSFHTAAVTASIFVQKTDFVIKTDAEQKVLQDKADDLVKRNEELRCRIDTQAREYEIIKEQMGTHSKQLQEALDKLQKETEAKQQTEKELENMKNKVGQDSTLSKNLTPTIEEVEKCASQVQECHNTASKDLQHEKNKLGAMEKHATLTVSKYTQTEEHIFSLDLQQKFDEENQLRNTAETNLKASQKTNEELYLKIEDLQKQVQTEKKNIEAMEEQYKLSASVAAETARKDISDLQQKFDEENQLRNTAETNLKASQKTNEELSLKIEDLKKQVQTEKKNIEAMEEQYKLSASVAAETARKDISDMKVVSSRTVDVELKDDRWPPWISGCVFLSTGQLVLCDYSNKKIKLLSSDLTVEDSLDLQGRRPRDISAVSSSTVIITLPGEQELQYIELAPRLQLGRVIKLDKECYGVCVFGEEIYVTCYTGGEEDDGEVRILDYNGSVKRRLGVPSEHHSSYMFRHPQYVSVSTVTGRIYVSDWGHRTLTCLSKDGSIIYQYSDPELREPRGLYLDTADNVIVCGHGSNNLLKILPRGEKVSTLLSEKDGIKDPQSVAYRSSDGTLVVGCTRDKKLHVFKLSH